MSLRPQLRHAQHETSASTRSNSRIPTKSGPENTKLGNSSSEVSRSGRRTSRSNLPVLDLGTRENVRGQTSKTPAQRLPDSHRRRSNIPAAITTSSYSHDALYPPAMRTPSLISGGSSVTTFDSPKSQGLRRKPSGAIDIYAAQKRADSVDMIDDPTRASESRRFHAGDFDDSVLGISLPPTLTHGEHKDYSHNKAGRPNPPELLRLVTPPILPSMPPMTPSTRYTDSPFSQVPTVSSASSYSSTAAPFAVNTSSPKQMRSPANVRKGSKDVTLKPALAPVRESSTSSSKASSLALESKLSSSKGERNKKPETREAPVGDRDTRRVVTRNKLTKGQPAISTSKSTSQMPPELAHLSDNVSPAKQPHKPPPPARPSRDGTPNIDDMFCPSPVVQSDRPQLRTASHKRNPSSQDTPISISAESPKILSRLRFSPKPKMISDSSRVDSAVSPPSTNNLSRSTTLETTVHENLPLSRKDSPVVANPSPAKSRFGFFSRKPKVENPKPNEKSKRLSAKGPAAGTGHEGYYTRFSNRGRGGSMASSNGLRSPSADSSSSSLPLQPSSRKGSSASKDGPDMDDFLRERLRPVILRGSGSTSTTAISNPNTSATSLDASSRIATSVYHNPQSKLSPSAMQSSAGSSPDKKPPLVRRETLDSSDGDVAISNPTFAQSSDSLDGNRFYPASPENSRNLPEAPSVLQKIYTDDVLPLQEGQWFGSRKARPLTPIDRKRNFSQHVQASPRPKDKARVLTAIHGSKEAHRPLDSTAVAHYALSNPVHPVDLDEVNRIVQENDTSADESQPPRGPRSRLVPYEGRHIGLLPAPSKNHHHHHHDKPRLVSRLPATAGQKPSSNETPEAVRRQNSVSRRQSSSVEKVNTSDVSKPQTTEITRQQGAIDVHPAITPEMRQETFSASALASTTSPPRQSRLSPVGRIPRVKSTRDRDVKLPVNSFSRPFARTQPRPCVKPPGSVYSQIREMASPIESSMAPITSATYLLSLPSAVSTLRARNGLPVDQVDGDVSESEEFFNIPARKDSGQSFSSSSGYPSWIAPNDIQLQQEDVWNEYNDFMDEVIPLRTSRGTSLGTVLHYGQAPVGSRHEQFRIPSMVGAPPTIDLPLPPQFTSESGMMSLRQQVAKFLQPSLSPLSSERLSGAHFSFSSVPDSVSSRHSHASVHSRSTSLPESNVRNSQLSFASSQRFKREPGLLDISEAETAHETFSDKLRIPAILTSKWLSFGRVLFSPAHNEMSLAQNPRVLVIDELSSDWSHFVALAYPSATIYNLSTATKSSYPSNLQQQKPPPNHRQIPLNGLATLFPFPKGFFNAVVFRFPKATTESTYQFVVSECKRVLRPGGFLETVVLDLDLMNMGTEVRRALRGLKTRMQQQDRGICLSNLSDVLVRLIGRRGFEGVQRCVVGVPAAGRIPRSQDDSSVSSDGYCKPIWHTEEHDDNGGREFSFADLLDQTRNSRIEPDSGNDESITKMVAKVGRWWYSSCYEKALLPGDQSIWSDRGLLRECEKQGTSFRLLICHAQKPTQVRRRTVSV